MPLNFIHCADLHLGSRFCGLSETDKDLAKLLSDAPFGAFERIAEEAVRQKAAFVTIGGDVFEEEHPPLEVRRRFYIPLRKLEAANIFVFIAAGNHDPLDTAWNYADELPGNVRIFPAGQAEFFPVSGDFGTVYVGGASYSGKSAPADLAAKIAAAAPEGDALKFAVLHTNIDADKTADPYAPAALSELRSSKIDGWLLGHIHTFRCCETFPLIVYSGTPQGRAVDEPGEHGAVLVKVDGLRRCQAEFFPADRFRFMQLTVDISGINSPEKILQTVGIQAKRLCGDFNLLLRLKLIGKTACSRVLRRSNFDELSETFAAELKNAGSIFLEKLEIATSEPAAALSEEMRAFAALLKELCDELPAERFLDELRSKQRGIPEFSRAELSDICAEAAERLLDELNSGGGK